MDYALIANLREYHQQLVRATCKTAAELVTWFGAVQGQEYAATKWGLGLRLPHVKDNDIEEELTKGHILRTHLLRPTWHFVSLDDIRWLLLLTAPRVHAANAYMYRQLELEATLFKKCNVLLTKSLEGNNYLTREELQTILKEHRILVEGHRLSYLMMQAELEGLICSGPRRGNQFTYALLEERVPPARTKDKEEALAELALRYITSRGPATLKDFATWSGLTVTESKKGLATVSSQLEKQTIEKEDYYSASFVTSKKQTQRLFLLPIYDEMVMGYKDRTSMMQFRASFKKLPSFSFDSMMLLDGQIIGTWKRTIHPKYIQVLYSFFQQDKDQSSLLKLALSRLEEFYELEIRATDAKF